MSLSGRYSPYSKYIIQRELSVPALNRLESFESDDGEFYYVVDENMDEDSGRKTSIGFVHKKQLSSSMSNISRRRPHSEMRKQEPRYMSTPNFIKINKKAVIQSSPMEKINPRLILHRSLKGVLKVYNNTNIKTNKSFSVDNLDIFLPNGKVDPNLLAPMPINSEDKRSEKLNKHQLKAKKKRELALKRRKLSPIAGTPHKDSKDKEEKKTPKHKMDAKARIDERLKKDKFGRLLTPKKASLPNFRATKKSIAAAKKKAEKLEDERHEEPMDELTQARSVNFLQQIQSRGVLGRAIKARIAKREPPPLTKQPSRQSIDSIFQEKTPILKKKPSLTSLKSISASIRTIGSMKSFGSKASKNSDESEIEQLEAGDEITKLQNVKDAKKDAKSKAKGSILAKTKVLRMTSASSTRSQKEVTVPPPSRTASKSSLLSQTGKIDEAAKAALDTPSRKSEVLRAPSASSIMSMTTAAITSNPLATTLAITNTLATQGAEIIDRKQRAAGIAATEEVPPAPVAAAVVVAAASHPDADKASMSSQQTISSQKTTTSKSSRKTSAKTGKTSRKSSAKATEDKPRSRAGSILSAVVGVNSAIRYLRRKHSNESIKSEKSDAPQLTTGPGHGAENLDSTPGKILEHSKKSLEQVQKTVDKATSEIHQTINENLSDLRTLEKKLSKKSLLQHDANNNDVEKGLSRHSTKLDMASGSKTSMMASQQLLSASKTRDKDQMSVNAISVAPDAQSQSALQQQPSQDSIETNSSTR